MLKTFNWARVVSNVLSPPVIWGLLAFFVALNNAANPGQSLIQSGLYILFVCLIPAGYIGWMVYRGQIADMHLPEQKDRLWPFLVTIVSTTVLLLILVSISATPTMPILTLGTLLQIILMMLITQVWKISIHAMSVSSGVTTIGVFFGLLPALVLSPLILLVGLARLKLQRHTVAQVIAGTLLGVLIVIVLAASFHII